MISNQIIFIVGPTAVGKSEVAFALAPEIEGEIVSCDSMQIYREIQIACNKPPEDILKKIPHHLIDVISVSDEYDVVRYNTMAVQAIKEIHARNLTPIVVGGSGMYVQVLLDGIFEGTPKDEALRENLKQQAQQKGNQFLYDQLKEKDRQAADKIHPNDLKRIIRALEVCMIENKPISELQKKREGLWGKYEIMLFALDMDRERLYQKIDDRVDRMFKKGLIEEIRSLDKVSLSYTAESLIGVKEIKGFLKGAYDEQQARDIMKLNTRHLAKRQLTWLRKDKRLNWINVEAVDTPEKIAEKILQQLNPILN